jgi:hypothetical protein
MRLPLPAAKITDAVSVPFSISLSYSRFVLAFFYQNIMLEASVFRKSSQAQG